MAVDDLHQYIVQICFRIDVVHLAGFDQRGEDRPVLAAAIRAGKEMVLASECDRTHGALDDIGVDLDAAVVEAPDEPVTARERAAARRGSRCTSGDGGR